MRYPAARDASIALSLLVCAGLAGAAPPCPEDLDWLGELCGGHGAALCETRGRIYLTELANGQTEKVGNGERGEFSPDGTKVAWIDGRRALGRARTGGRVHVIAEDVDVGGGVHWIAEDEVVLRLRRGGWHRVKLDGRTQPVPELDRLGRGGRECDVKLCEDGVWSYACGTSWRTSDGRRGKTGGNCSPSLSPDGRSVTGLRPGHKECRLTRIRPGGLSGRLRWVYDYHGSKGFDNHRWASADKRFVVCEDEKHHRLVVMRVGTTNATAIGPKGRGEMRGDFTSTPRRATPWPEAHAAEGTGDGADAPTWPPDADKLAFLWDHAGGTNAVSPPGRAGRQPCRLLPDGQARLGRFGDLRLIGGRFAAEPETAADVLGAVAGARALTVELLYTPPEDASGDADILTLAGREGPVFRLRRRGRGVEADGSACEGGAGVARLTPGEPAHLAVVIDADSRGRGELTAFVDGRRSVARKRMRCSLAGGGGGAKLVLGDADAVAGRVEALAIRAAGLSAERVAASARAARARLAGRAEPPRLVVDAVLLDRPELPDPSNYPQTLAVCRYRVAKVREGTCKAGEIHVAHRAILNGRVVADLKARTPGRGYRLVLHRFAAHPELSTLKIVAAPEDLDATIYCDAD